MAIVDVQNWLAGKREFAAGVDLLKEHGKPSGALLTLFQRGETGYSRERLVEALQECLRIAVETQEKTPRPKPNLHAGAHAAVMKRLGNEEFDEWPTHQYPPELQEVKQNARQWISEEAHLRGEVRRMPLKEERYRTFLRLVELDQLRTAAYKRLDAFRATGTDIGQVQEAPKSLAELYVERNNLRTYVSRAQSGVRPASAEQVATWKQRLSIIQTAIDAGNPG